MVFWYETSTGHVIYMGIDKFENEELIKYGWEEDVWFHVEDLSSAHVYLRLKKGETWDTIDQQAVKECCQLVKENSITGKKKEKVDVIYTPWTNLHKTPGMETGAIGFHNETLRKKEKYIERDRDIIKAFLKTEREEKEPNFRDLKESHILEEKHKRHIEMKEKMRIEEEINKQRRIVKESLNYNYMLDKGSMMSNKNAADNDDDFI